MNGFCQTMDRFCGRKYFPLLFIPIAALFLCIYAIVTSPFFLFDGADSAIFKTIGLAILKGKVPYVDIFDHKGPIIFFINALGQWMIPGRTGIFLLEIVSLSISLFLLFKISRLYVKPFAAFLCTLASLFFFGGMLTEGDQVEEWELPFLALSLYEGLAFLKKGKDAVFTSRIGFLLGISFAYVFLIRPNDGVAIPGGIMLGLSLYVLVQKHYADLFRGVAAFALGSVLIALPVFIYFACHHAVMDLINGTILVNTSYAGGLKEQFLSCFGHGKMALSVILIALLALSFHVHDRAWVILLPASLFVYILMGARLYPHYYMVLVPFICLYITFLAKNKDWPLVLLAAAVLLFSQQAWNESLLKTGRKALQHRIDILRSGQEDVARFYRETDRLLDLVPEDEKDQIWNYNLGWTNTGESSFSMYIHQNLVQSNIVTFGANDALIQKDDIRKHAPHWLLMNNQMVPLWERVYLLDPDRLQYIESHFIPVARTDTTICDITLYRWKEF